MITDLFETDKIRRYEAGNQENEPERLPVFDYIERANKAECTGELEDLYNEMVKNKKQYSLTEIDFIAKHIINLIDWHMGWERLQIASKNKIQYMNKSNRDKTETSIYNSLVLIEKKYGFSRIRYTQIEECAREHGAPKAITTGMVRSGYATRDGSGYYKVMNTASEEWAAKIRECFRRMQKESHRRRKIVLEHDSRQSGIRPTETTETPKQAASIMETFTDNQLIDEAKRRGYVVYKWEVKKELVEL